MGMEMGKRFSSLVLLAAALALAGLGHYYLLYQRIYVWDAVLFYVVAALLLAWTWRSADARPDRAWALARPALRRPGVLLRGLLLWRATRPLVVVLATANGLAALAAFLVPPPAGLLVVLLLWAGGVVALGVRFPRPRWPRPRPRPAPEVRGAPIPALVSAEVVQPRRHAVPLAITGWLLLLAGMVALTFPDALGPLRVIGNWLQPGLAELRVDVPLPPDVWSVGLMLSCVGMILIAWTRGGVDKLPGASPLGGEAPVLRATSRPSWPWLALALVGDLVWLGVVYSAVVSSTS